MKLVVITGIWDVKCTLKCAGQLYYVTLLITFYFFHTKRQKKTIRKRT